MTKTVLFDEIHVSLLIPVGLSSKRSLAIRRITNSKAFDQKIAHAIKHVLESYPTTKEVSITLSR